eukprot:g1775.t1
MAPFLIRVLLLSRLVSAGAVPTYTFSVEDPVVAHRAYNKTHAWFSQLLVPSSDADGQRLLLDFSMGGDGTPCPPPGGPPQNCSQSMLSVDGGRSWALLSNRFAPNAVLPGARGSGSLVTLAYRQALNASSGNTSAYSTGQLVQVSAAPAPAVHVLRSFRTVYAVNRSVPGLEHETWPAVLVHCGTIVRAAGAGGGRNRTEWLTTLYGHGEGPYRHWSRRPTAYVARSPDGGATWSLRSKLEWRPAFGDASDGPGEPTLARLRDGRLLLVFRADSTSYYWKAYSADDGESWSEPEVMGQWSVRPQLRLLSNGLLVLGGGRPGIKLWVCADGRGEAWGEINIAAEHNKMVRAARPELLYAAKVTNASSPASGRADPPNTSSYTSIFEVFEGEGGPDGVHSTVVVSYDRLANGWAGPPGAWGDADTMLTMRLTLTAVST